MPVSDSMHRSNGSRPRLLGEVIDGRACSGLPRAGAPHHQRAGDADRPGPFLEAPRTPQAMKDGIGELTAADFARAIPRRLRDRLVRGHLQTGEDVAALRRFTGLSQAAFARALGISVHTLRNWAQGRGMPKGPLCRGCASLCGTRECFAKTWPWRVDRMAANLALIVVPQLCRRTV